MTFKLELSKSTERLLKSTRNKGMIKDVQKEFSKRGPVKIKQAIIQDMIKGISPVKGAGKYKKYSKGYIKEIRSGKSKRMREATLKSIRPVNLRLTGTLHRSLSSLFKRGALIIQFKNFLADIHNRRGAGKSKVIRRMLPTEKGEQFNRRINKVMVDQVKEAVNKVAKQFSGQ